MANKKLDAVLNKINKDFGGTIVSKVSKIKDKLKQEFYPTPSYELNLALCGGIAKGKTVEFFGESGCGKTSLWVEIIKLNQKLDPNFVAGWFETEGSITEDQLEMFGIDMDRLVYWDQTELSAEKALDVLRALVSSGEFKLIVTNSVAGLCPDAELKGDLSDSQVALMARTLSKLFRTITSECLRTGCTLGFVNQLRATIASNKYAPQTTTSGGKALAFYATTRIAMSKLKLDKSDPLTEEEGLKICCRIKKNRMAKKNPFVMCNYFAVYGEGIDGAGELPELLAREGVLEKGGSWIYWKNDKGEIITIGGEECRWQSKKKAVAAVKENEELRKAMEDALSDLMKNGSSANKLSAEEIKAIEEEEKALVEELDLEQTAIDVEE